MHNITEVNTFTAAVSVCDDGDPGAAASFQPTAQALANRTNNLNSRVTTLENRASAQVTTNGSGGATLNAGLRANAVVGIGVTGTLGAGGYGWMEIDYSPVFSSVTIPTVNAYYAGTNVPIPCGISGTSTNCLIVFGNLDPRTVSMIVTMNAIAL